MGLKLQISSTTMALALFCGASALANPAFIDARVERIQSDGFEIQEVYQSLFGRYVIIAEAEVGVLEIVIDQHSGEVLRRRFTERRIIDYKNSRGSKGTRTAEGGGGGDDVETGASTQRAPKVGVAKTKSNGGR